MIWTSWISGLLIVALMLAFAMLSGGKFVVYIDIGSLIVVMGLVSGGLLMSYGFVAVCRSFVTAIDAVCMPAGSRIESDRVVDQKAPLPWVMSLLGITAQLNLIRRASRADQASAEVCVEAVEVFGHARQLSWAAGVLGMVIGVLAVFSDLSDPSVILQSVSFLVLPVVYGGVLGEFVFGTLRAWVQRRMIKLACVGPEQG